MASTEASSSNATPGRMNPSSYATTMSSRTVGTAGDPTQLQSVSAGGTSVPRHSKAVPPSSATAGTIRCCTSCKKVLDLHPAIGVRVHEHEALNLCPFSWTFELKVSQPVCSNDQ